MTSDKKLLVTFVRDHPSNHEDGVWALSEIDDRLEIDGVAACMAELLARFGRRVRQLLEAEARKALGAIGLVDAAALSVVASGNAARPLIRLNGPERNRPHRSPADVLDRRPELTTRVHDRQEAALSRATAILGEHRDPFHALIKTLYDAQALDGAAVMDILDSHGPGLRAGRAMPQPLRRRAEWQRWSARDK